MRRTITTTVFALALLAGTPAASAQDALGRGNALDNNLNTTSGKRNLPRRSVTAEVQLRNAVVTGNVAAGRHFRGSVGYTAPRDFRGETGSDNLFRFAADSFYSGLATQNISGIGGVRNSFSRPTLGQIGASSGSFVLERPTTTGSDFSFEGRPNTVIEGDQSQQTGAGGAGIRLDPFNRLNGTLRSTSAFFLRSSESPEILTLRKPLSPNDAPLALTASPISGIKPISVANPSLGYEQVKLEPLGSITDTLGGAGDGREGQIDPHRMIVDRLSQRITTLRTNEVSDAIDTGIDGHATGEPVLFDEDDEASNPPNHMPLTPEFLDQLRQQLTDGASEFSTMPGSLRIPGQRDKDPEDGETADDESPFYHQRLIDNAVKALGGDSIVIDRLFNDGRPPSTFKNHMQAGQQALQDGKWFDAEERFTAALQTNANSPLAAAGRVNAQIGAGMYRSASLNLRALYRTYPEMLDVRFDESLLPSSDRLAKIRDQLRERMRLDSAFARDSGFLLAFLGYQYHSKQDIEEGFGVVERVNTSLSVDSDPLDLVLERVWAK